jgi:hypothetical protein
MTLNSCPDPLSVAIEQWTNRSPSAENAGSGTRWLAPGAAYPEVVNRRANSADDSLPKYAEGVI